LLVPIVAPAAKITRFPGKHADADFGKVLATLQQNPRGSRGSLRVRIILEHAMRQQRHFDTNEPTRRETALVWKMIDELDHSVQLLNADIAAEEERVRIFDPSDPAYPILASSLALRRNNLMDTIAALKERVPGPDQPDLFADVA
jgi:hypothetical protein